MRVEFFPTGARSAGTHLSPPISTGPHCGIRLFGAAANVTNSTSVTLTLQALDQAGGSWVDIPGAAFAAMTTTIAKTLSVYPGVAETNNESVSDVIAGAIRMQAVVVGSTAGSITFSACGDLLP